MHKRNILSYVNNSSYSILKNCLYAAFFIINKMSSEDVSNNSNNSSNVGRVVTDSVHVRFRQIQVHCEICNLDFVGNHSEIKKHFNSTHPSKESCYYCRGKVFAYIQVPLDGSSEESKRIVYHRCDNT